MIAAIGVVSLVAACSDNGGTEGGGGAGNYPGQNVTFVVPFSAGGPTDTVTRMIAEPMAKELGAKIVVQNVEGAGGTSPRCR
jgi:tripartite-type tricarboxylate transporter receptor subunit TctC